MLVSMAGTWWRWRWQRLATLLGTYKCRGGGGRKRHKWAWATLTRGGPHTGCPELPQDEALLALGQRQEEFIGFYALLTETEAHGILNGGRGPGGSLLHCSHQLPICFSASPSSKRRNTLGKAGGSLFYAVHLPP